MEKLIKQLHQTICNQMTRLRNERKYSQETVARALGVAQTTYGRYEAGVVHISAAQLYQLSCFYNVEVGQFFVNDTILQKEVSLQEKELQRLKVANDVLVRANRQLMDGNKALEDDFIQHVVEYLIRKQLPKQ